MYNNIVSATCVEQMLDIQGLKCLLLSLLLSLAKIQTRSPTSHTPMIMLDHNVRSLPSIVSSQIPKELSLTAAFKRKMVLLLSDNRVRVFFIPFKALNRT